jgi:hypothetical protein
MVQLDGGIMVGKLIRWNENKSLPEQTVLADGRHPPFDHVRTAWLPLDEPLLNKFLLD